MLPDLPGIYWILVLLRIILICIPQLGYIHPDELFQSVEIFVGKVFEVEYSPPWEFNSTFPIRSMILPYFTIGMSYRILLTLNYFIYGLFNIKLITPYALIIAPRLMIGLSSFLVDFSIYKICMNNNEKYKTKLIVLASSYVMIIYGTRTFSNTLELILFALLLYYVSESLIFSNILLRKKEYLNYRYKNSANIKDKVKFHKLRLYLTSDSLRNCIEISIITVLGFFNRPTFLAFAIFPIFFWLYRGLGSKVTITLQFHWRILIFIICCIPTVLFCVLVDSFFYGYITWGEIGVLDISINNFVFTPLNFVKYNINTKNLAKHGLHPHFLHILVNVPLLFNVLAVGGFVTCMEYAQNIVKRKFHLLPTVRSVKGLMILSLIAPIALLSIFPHQEPRFLIPIIIPLIYLYGNTVLPETDKDLVKTQDMAVAFHQKKSSNTPSTILIKLWLIINTILLIFYGFIHQAGVYQVTNYLSKEIQSKPVMFEYHILTSHIYSLPESFLLQKSNKQIYLKKDKEITISKRVHLYEEGSLDLDKLFNKIELILEKNRLMKNYRVNTKFKVYLTIPGSLTDKLHHTIIDRNVTLQDVTVFCPHLSTEAFPDLLSDFSFLIHNFNFENLLYYLLKLRNNFSLNLYEINYTNDANTKKENLAFKAR